MNSDQEHSRLGKDRHAARENQQHGPKRSANTRVRPRSSECIARQPTVVDSGGPRIDRLGAKRERSLESACRLIESRFVGHLRSGGRGRLL